MWLNDVRELLREVKCLKNQIADLKLERSKVTKEVELSEQIVKLKTEISDLTINKSKLNEEHQKQERELRHMIGLEKKRQEFEIDQAKREVTTKVKEENLAADKKRFEEQLKFHNDRFEKEVGYLKDLMGQVLLRLPNVTASIEKKGK